MAAEARLMALIGYRKSKYWREGLLVSDVNANLNSALIEAFSHDFMRDEYLNAMIA